MVKENLERVRERVSQAARGAGRDPSGIRLIAVTKGVPVERIREAIECGVTEIGENRVQEAEEKRKTLGTVHSGDSPRMTRHLIGHLQRNKVSKAVELFDVIHSVDSLELVEALERRAALRQAQGERGLEVLIQVNVSGEATKFGCRPEEVEGLAEGILKAKQLKLAGLMTIAPFVENPGDARPIFRQLRELRDDLTLRLYNSTAASLHLSMGMSHDFEAAVQEGATMLRIGTAIFGERNL